MGKIRVNLVMDRQSHNLRQFKSLSVDFLFNFQDDNCASSCTGWAFNYSELDVSSSIQESYQLICDDEIFMKIHASVYFIGLGLGSLFGGHLGDRIGRVKVIRLSNIATAGLSATMALTNSYFLHVVSYTIISGFIGTIWIAAYAYTTEIGTIKLRAKVSASLAVALCTGYIACGLIALVLADWRHLLLAISLFQLISFGITLFMDESPRWLWSQKRYLEIRNVWLNAVKFEGLFRNQKIEDENYEELFSTLTQDSKPNQNFLKNINSDLKSVCCPCSLNEESRKDINTTSESESLMRVYRYPRLLFRIGMSIIYWVSTYLMYFGVLFGAQLFGQQIHLFTILQGVGAVAGAVLGFLVINRAGRKIVSLMSFVCLSLCFLLCIIFPSSLRIIILPSTLFARVCLEIVGFLAFLWPAEMMPTTIRTSVLGLFSFVSRVTSMLVPFIETLDVYWESLPLLILAVISVGTIIPVLFLPETRNEKLPESLKEGNEFGFKREQIDAAIQNEAKDMNERNDCVENKAFSD